MSEFKLDRFKYTWKGNWSPSTVYKKDDVIRINGRTYTATKGHLSASIFETDLNAIIPDSNPPIPDPYWHIMIDGRSFVGNWEQGINYHIGDIVFFDGSLHLCVEGHVSVAFGENLSYWSLFIQGTQFKEDWLSATEYGAGAIVTYGSNNYKCIQSHISQTLLEDDLEKWQVYVQTNTFQGEWTADTFYAINDYVKFGGSIHRVTTSHTSQQYFDVDNFILEFQGKGFAGTYSQSVNYGTGDIVKFGGDFFSCVTPNIGIAPDDTADSIIYWEKLLDSTSFKGIWVEGTSYISGDLVIRGGDLILANQTIDNSSLEDINDANKWDIVIPNQSWKNNWRVSTTYNKGDIIYWLGESWVCTDPHVSTFNNFPGDNGSGFDLWDLLIQAGDVAALDTKGDLLTYNLSRTYQGDGSTFGPAAVAIGDYQQILSATDQDVIWRDFNSTETTVIYVSKDGTDRIDYGKSQAFPLRTIKYAAQMVEDTVTGPCKIKVSTGFYEEILPINIPKITVIMGDELRSTSVSAAPAVTDISNLALTKAYLNHLSSIVGDLFSNTIITPQFGNTITQDISLPPAQNVSEIFIQLQGIIVAYLDAHLLGEGDNVEITGSNTDTTNIELLYAHDILIANQNFLQSESYNFLRNNFVTETFDEEITKNDVRQFVRGIAKDIKRTGNYNSIIAARSYKNTIQGSNLEDMFYCRDATGVRNMTVYGLNGTLAPLDVDKVYQRPTAGAYCSLDPGWGPDDESVWIMTRSPYIQGVTTVGTACVGQKIDGYLHNGGNRSMVSNDFTQVLSDGIGAWVTNNGRAELVSVFTYYCNVGYLTESGGIIRATNGNNSYGNYGSVSLGVNQDEVPATATVNNREQHAIVQTAYAGEITDKILAFEYSHAGENYTTATAEIIGSGNFAETRFEDFRDGGIFEVRLVQPEDSNRKGGAGYINVGNNAQSGTDTTIQLASNDIRTADQLIGQRLVIISGVGTGQYGNISSYDYNTKTATITKESTGELGWDHIVPGIDIPALLATNTVYRIEPKITVPSPGFDVYADTLSNFKLWNDAYWGETLETYTGINLNFGTAGTIDILQQRAIITVAKNGKNYNVTMTDFGAGYDVGDEFTILGSNLGGTDGAHDLTLTVTGTTDDSTNAITTFTTSGKANAGRWIAVCDGIDFGWSDNGINWNENRISYSDNWHTIINGNATFVVIPRSAASTVLYSYNGKEFFTASLPIPGSGAKMLRDIAFGNGTFVITCAEENIVYTSTDAQTWTRVSLPVTQSDDGSTRKQWQGIAYGFDQFVIISGSDRAIATSADGLEWTIKENILPADIYDYTGLEFGFGRFVAIASNTSQCIYTVDETIEEWRTAINLPNDVDSTPLEYKRLRWANGQFVAVGSVNTGTTKATNIIMTSDNGVLWNEKSLTESNLWVSVAYGDVQGSGKWLAVAYNDNITNVISTGAQALMRVVLDTNSIGNIKIWNPGSGYDKNNPPIATIYDNSYVVEAQHECRIGDGVLAQPTFFSRGIGYRSSTTTVTLTGDGYADIIPEGNSFTVDNLVRYPGPGAQIAFQTILDDEPTDDEDYKLFTLAVVIPLGSNGNGGFRATFRVSPNIENRNKLEHGQSLTIREKYSQNRITGHDFLDIGTGNFTETNYPKLYVDGEIFFTSPENEVFEEDGGRVFYTSTDQDGNFRGGELFAVEQATGVVTISADFFNLDGLSELALGGVRLGGSGTVIREFSTDVLFTEDSNNIIPTQRAIIAFLASRLSEGGSQIETNNLISGLVKIGGADNIIDHTGNAVEHGLFSIKFATKVDFSGNENTGVGGFMLAQAYFLRDTFY